MPDQSEDRLIEMISAMEKAGESEESIRFAVGEFKASAKAPAKPKRDLLAEHQANLRAQGLEMVDLPPSLGSGTPGRAIFPEGALNPGAQALEFLKAPVRAAQGMYGMARDIGRMDEPLENKLANYAQGAVEGIGKLFTGSPMEQSGALGDIAFGSGISALTGSLMKRFSPASRLDRAMNPSLGAGEKAAATLGSALNKITLAQGVTAGEPSNFLTTLRSASPWIGKELTEIPAKGTEMFAWERVTNKAANEFYSRFYEPLSKQMAKVDMTPEARQIGAKLRETGQTLYQEINNPASMRRFERTAQEFESRNLNLNQLEDIRAGLNKDLQSYYSKDPTARALAENNPKTKILLAEHRAVVEAIDAKFDQLTGSGAPNMADVLRTYRDIRSVADRARVQAAEHYQGSQIASAERFVGATRLPSATKTGVATEGARIALSRMIPDFNDPARLMRSAMKDLLGGKSGFGAEPFATPGEIGKFLPPGDLASYDKSGLVPGSLRGLASAFEQIPSDRPIGRAPTSRQLGGPSIPEGTRLTLESGDLVSSGGGSGMLGPGIPLRQFNQPLGGNFPSGPGYAKPNQRFMPELGAEIEALKKAGEFHYGPQGDYQLQSGPPKYPAGQTGPLTYIDPVTGQIRTRSKPTGPLVEWGPINLMD